MELICTVFLVGMMVLAGLAVLALPVGLYVNSKNMDNWN